MSSDCGTQRALGRRVRAFSYGTDVGDAPSGERFNGKARAAQSHVTRDWVRRGVAVLPRVALALGLAWVSFMLWRVQFD